MPEKDVHLFIFDGFADWEPAHAVAELRRHGKYRVRTVGLGGAAVESMGGLQVLPSIPVSEVEPATVALFILPGGDAWESQPMDSGLKRLLERLDTHGVPIAAICAATVAIAREGLLRGRKHTSNGRSYLQKHVPHYREGASYVDGPAVRDRGLITASGLSAVEFAREIFEELQVLEPADRERWAELFRGGRIPKEEASR